MKVIGLTGGMGTGKSTVSSYLREKGCEIIDADLISRKMTSKDSPALEEIRNAFGKKCFFDDGSLNRKALGDLVFADKTRLSMLQQIITKKVVEEIKRRIFNLKTEGFKGIAVIDAPLLFECGLDKITDENWLVTADLNVRIDRVIRRDHLSREQIISRINNQISVEEAKKRCQCILDNSGTLEVLIRQIEDNVERIKNEDQ